MQVLCNYVCILLFPLSRNTNEGTLKQLLLELSSSTKHAWPVEDASLLFALWPWPLRLREFQTTKAIRQALDTLVDNRHLPPFCHSSCVEQFTELCWIA